MYYSGFLHLNNMQTQTTMENLKTSRDIFEENLNNFRIKNARNLGWMVLSPTDKQKPVALFNRHDHAVLFAVSVYGERESWEVKSCDIRIPLYCY